MIGGISNIGQAGMVQMQQSQRPRPLSDEQRQTVSDVLANYDAENLTESDAAAIVEAFSAAGIQPGRELAEAMAEYGFDAKTVGDLAGVEGPRQGPPPGMGGQPVTLNISDEMLQDLNELLDAYYSDSISESDRETTLDAIKEIFQQTVPEGGLVNIYA